MWHKCDIFDDFFEALNIGVILVIIGFIGIIAVVTIMKYKDWKYDEDNRRKKQIELDLSLHIWKELSPKLTNENLLSYWKTIESKILYLKKSQSKSEPPYAFEALIQVFVNGKMEIITINIETGYKILDIIERELNKRGQRSPRQ